MKDFGFTDEDAAATIVGEDKSLYRIKGGERAGLDRLEKFLKSTAFKNYQEDRLNLIGSDYKFKLTPWIANGSLSMKKVYKEVKAAGKNASAKHYVDDLFNLDF